MGSINCLIPHILQNILFYVQQKKKLIQAWNNMKVWKPVSAIEKKKGNCDFLSKNFEHNCEFNLVILTFFSQNCMIQTDKSDFFSFSEI